MTEWQTIETAPKDGTLIDLWIGGERYVDCYWRKAEDWEDDDASGWVSQYEKVLGAPTHWMPRPAPPTP